MFFRNGFSLFFLSLHSTFFHSIWKQSISQSRDFLKREIGWEANSWDTWQHPCSGHKETVQSQTHGVAGNSLGMGHYTRHNIAFSGLCFPSCSVFRKQICQGREHLSLVSLQGPVPEILPLHWPPLASAMSMNHSKWILHSECSRTQKTSCFYKRQPLLKCFAFMTQVLPKGFACYPAGQSFSQEHMVLSPPLLFRASFRCSTTFTKESRAASKPQWTCHGMLIWDGFNLLVQITSKHVSGFAHPGSTRSAIL